MSPISQRKNVRNTIDKIEYGKALAKFICSRVSGPPLTCSEVTDFADQKAILLWNLISISRNICSYTNN